MKLIIKSFFNIKKAIYIFIYLTGFLFSSASYSSLFTQSPLSDGNTFLNFAGDESADNFMLSSDAEITSISWWGAFDSETLGAFTIKIYEDNAGLPSASSLHTFSTSDLEGEDTGLEDIDGFNIYLFDYDLTTNIALMNNTTYYLSLVGTEDFWWQSANNTGSNFLKTGSGWVNSLSSNSGFDPGDLAFKLNGNKTGTVPEPNTLIIFTIAFLGFSFYRRNIKNS